MNMRHTILIYSLVAIALGSCRTQEEFTKRKYTEGQFHDLNLGKAKSEKNDGIVQTEYQNDSVKTEIIVSNVTEGVPDIKEDFQSLLIPSFEVLENYVPEVIRDSSRFQLPFRDSTWYNDTLPQPIETALASQAVLGLGTVGALVSTVAPEAVWIFWIFILIAPVSLLVSLFCGAIALGQLNTGQIDNRYRRYMKLWATCLLVNVAIACTVMIMYTV